MPETSFPFGPATQAEIYVAGADDLPLDPDEWEARARAVLEPGPFDYIAGGAGGESTMQANRDAFARWRLRPAMLAGNLQRDLHVSVLGTTSPVPFMLAPVGVLSAARRDGDLAVAGAAAASGVPWVVSTAASTSMETIAQTMGSTPRWYQLYWVSDREVVGSLVQRAEAAGYAAIVLTLDTLQLGWRVRDLKNRYLPFILGEGIGQFTSDPVFRSRLSVSPEQDPRGAGATMVGMFSNLGLRWDDLRWLRERTRLPLLAKGVLRADDARRVLDAGFQGVIVSNHGGRQVDGAVAALDALVEVRDALGDEAVVLMDGGIRRGADVIKALALGADAVLLGRPYVYGLAVAGQAGVERVIRNLTAEIDLTLALVGGRDINALDRSWISLRP
jgi:isopentenyl diphosphate isomerase/L-lactate dehydrogenase-like FMN-dependent dehydrogenase